MGKKDAFTPIRKMQRELNKTMAKVKDMQAMQKAMETGDLTPILKRQVNKAKGRMAFNLIKK